MLRIKFSAHICSIRSGVIIGAGVIIDAGMMIGAINCDCARSVAPHQLFSEFETKVDSTKVEQNERCSN